MEMIYQGLRVSYIEEGQGPLVVLFHGWGANKELFQAIIRTLAVQYRVAAPDTPGFGQSQEPPQAWSLEEYCAFSNAFIEHVAGPEDGEVILAGHSHGGRTLIRLVGSGMLKLPVRKLILIDSAGIVHEKTPEQLRRIRRYKRGKKLLSLPPVKALFPHALEKFQSRSGSADYRMASPVMRQSMVKVVNEDVREYLPRIQAETLLVWGDQDRDTPLEDGRLMEQQIPGSGLAVLAGAGHFSFLDRQYQFLAVLRSFLEIQ
ncbi:MAG: alpha/beta hydrolase [Lachnospiraceae bacterium]|nr:alpha/beta hydrolase [Lachnospiraceae bacterium]